MIPDVIYNNIFNSDIAENRLQVAKNMGANHTILVKSSSEEILAQQIKEVMGGMPDITIECSGAESSIRLGIFVSIVIFFKSC